MAVVGPNECVDCNSTGGSTDCKGEEVNPNVLHLETGVLSGHAPISIPQNSKTRPLEVLLIESLDAYDPNVLASPQEGQISQHTALSEIDGSREPAFEKRHNVLGPGL